MPDSVGFSIYPLRVTGPCRADQSCLDKATRMPSVGLDGHSALSGAHNGQRLIPSGGNAAMNQETRGSSAQARGSGLTRDSGPLPCSVKSRPALEKDWDKRALELTYVIRRSSLRPAGRRVAGQKAVGAEPAYLSCRV